MTIAQLYAKTFHSHWDKPRYWTSGWAKEVAGYYARYISPALGHKTLGDITPTVLRQFHSSLKATPTTANRCIEVLSRMFTYAEEELGWPGKNPCALVKANVERRRNRYATEEEIRRIGDLLGVCGEKFPLEVGFLLVLALTGARPRSLMTARRDQLNRVGTAGVLTFEGKSFEATGESDTVIVPESAMAVLEKIPPQAKGLLFGPVKYRKVWDKIRKDAKCPDLWVRDLRRTFASIGLSSGIGKDTIGRLLNHHSSSTTDRYAKLLPHARIKAANQIAVAINDLMKRRVG